MLIEPKLKPPVNPKENDDVDLPISAGGEKLRDLRVRLARNTAASEGMASKPANVSIMI